MFVAQVRPGEQHGWWKNKTGGDGTTGPARGQQSLLQSKLMKMFWDVVPFIHPTGIRHICRFTSLHAADAHLQDRELYRVTVMSATIRYHGPPDPPGLPSGVLVVKVYLP